MLKIAFISFPIELHMEASIIRRQIDITTYQIRKIKADTSVCLFADEFDQFSQNVHER